jgi:hypothetical protein
LTLLDPEHTAVVDLRQSALAHLGQLNGDEWCGQPVGIEQRLKFRAES